MCINFIKYWISVLRESLAKLPVGSELGTFLPQPHALNPAPFLAVTLLFPFLPSSCLKGSRLLLRRCLLLPHTAYLSLLECFDWLNLIDAQHVVT